MNCSGQKAALGTLIIGALLALTLISAGRAAPETVHFTILHSNDEHSALLPHSPALDYHPDLPDDSIGGFARLAGAIAALRAEIEENEPVLLVSAGDFMGGTPFAWLALEGEAPELNLMQTMGYDLVILGNHEWDFGPDTLAEYLGAAGYPEAHRDTEILSGNAAFPAGHPLVDKELLMTTVISPAGIDLDLGFFSLLGEDAIALAPNADPVHFEDPLQFARRAVARLQEEGVDLIIAVTHSGLQEDVQLAREIPEVDVIIGGHCHTALPEPRVVGDTIIVQAGAHTAYLGCLQLSYDPASGELRVRNPDTGRAHLLPIDDEIDACPVIGARVDEYTGQLNRLLSEYTDGAYHDLLAVIGSSNVEISDLPERSETPYGNLIADAFRWAVREETGEPVDFAFQADGQIRGPLLPGTRPETRGRLSLYEILSTMGMGHGPNDEPGYPLVSIYLTGDEVRRALEISQLLSAEMGNAFFLQVSGLRHRYDPDRATLLRLPMIDQPIPTYRAVLEAERYTEEDPQMAHDHWAPLVWGDEQLYHVVADTFVASFVPRVGDMLPRLAIHPKNSAGEPIGDLQDHIVRANGQPLSAWRAVVDYVGTMPQDAEGTPRVPDRYTAADGRQVRVRTVPLAVWPAAGLVLLLVVIARAVLLRRRRTRMQERGNGGDGTRAVDAPGQEYYDTDSTSAQ